MYLQTQYYSDVFKSWKKVARLYIKNFACDEGWPRKVK
jgi:hypothetical protein